MWGNTDDAVSLTAWCLDGHASTGDGTTEEHICERIATLLARVPQLHHGANTVTPRINSSTQRHWATVEQHNRNGAGHVAADLGKGDVAAAKRIGGWWRRRTPFSTLGFTTSVR